VTQEERKKELLRVLTPEEYAKVKVPTKEQFREALRKGAEELRQHNNFKYKGRY